MTSARSALRSRACSSFDSSSTYGTPNAATYCLDRGPRDVDERPDEQQVAAEAAARRKRGQAVDAGSAQPLDQERLETVLAMVGRQDDARAGVAGGLRQRAVARFACRRLEPAPAAPHLDAPRDQRDLARGALGFAVREPLVGMGTEAVVDVHREQAADSRAADPREPRRRVEQRHRVAAAAERDDDDLAAARRHPLHRLGALRRLVAQPVESAGERVANGLQQRRRRPDQLSAVVLLNLP